MSGADETASAEAFFEELTGGAGEVRRNADLFFAELMGEPVRVLAEMAEDGPTTSPPISAYTQCDFIDPRIDVDAQFALYAQLRRGDAAAWTSLHILGAVKSSVLGGVYQQDRRVPAQRAIAYKQTWWTMFPTGKKAVVYPTPGLTLAKPDDRSARLLPILVYNKSLAGNTTALGDALAAAWAESSLKSASVTAPQPLGRPCPPRPAPPPPSTSTSTPTLPSDDPTHPAPAPSVKIMKGVIPYRKIFDAVEPECMSRGMAVLYYCGLWNSSTAVPGPKGIPIPIPGAATPSFDVCNDAGVSGSWIPTASAKIDNDKFQKWMKNCIRDSATTLIIQLLMAQAKSEPGVGSIPFNQDDFDREFEGWWSPSKGSAP